MTPGEALRDLRARKPLIHQITNYVVMNETANATLAIGALPVMAHAIEEVEELASAAGALVLNIGTLSAPWIDAMLLAGKAVKEAAYHLDHARSWVVRLGDGTDESHRRVQAGLDEVWPYSYELFERDPLVERLVGRGIAADPEVLRPQWEAHVTDALADATLAVPQTTWRPTGGRSGSSPTRRASSASCPPFGKFPIRAGR